jgi:hypothetical protein
MNKQCNLAFSVYPWRWKCNLKDTCNRITPQYIEATDGFVLSNPDESQKCRLE